MKIRLGYVAISKALENITTSSTITYTKFKEEKEPFDKLFNIISNNLDSLKEILLYNKKNNLHFYRLTSKLIPLSTHPEVVWDYKRYFSKELNRIGEIVKASNMRIDFHPDQFCVLNSTKKEVVENSIKILEYHYKLLDVLGINDKVLIIHVGSSVLGKDNSIKRFINNYNKLPKYLRDVIATENDDKVFNVEDVLSISDITGVPVVLDYHHYKCNKSAIDIEKILNSWKGKRPKMHFSTSRNSRDFRSHSEYVDSDEFINFIDEIKEYDRDVDVMIEAKGKDDALFRLVRELKYKTNYMFIDDTTFYV